MCVCVDLVIKRAQRMRRITLSSVTFAALLYFFILSLKWHDVQRVIEYKMCFRLSLQLLFEILPILKRIQWDITNVLRYLREVSVILARFQ